MNSPEITRHSNFLIAVGVVLLLLFITGISYYMFQYDINKPANSSKSTITSTVSTNSFIVTSVDLNMTPPTIDGVLCGSTLTVTYIVTFHVPSNTLGGIINFEYTTNNGRGTTPAKIALLKGEVTKTYTFISSGKLTSDNTFPGTAEVLVNNPNFVHSAQLQITGKCQS